MRSTTPTKLSLGFWLLGSRAQAFHVNQAAQDGDLAAAALIDPDYYHVRSYIDGSRNSFGTFTDGPLGIGNGVIVTTGQASQAIPGSSSNYVTGTGPFGLCGDANGKDESAFFVNFLDFTPTGSSNQAKINFIFATNGARNSPARFRIFFDGVDISDDVQGNPITTDSPYFGANPSNSGTSYRVSSPLFSFVTAPNPSPVMMHTLQLAICDVGDALQDSAVLFNVERCTNCRPGLTPDLPPFGADSVGESPIGDYEDAECVESPNGRFPGFQEVARNSRMTPELCARMAKGSQVFGVYDTICYAASSIGSTQTIESGECSLPCPGNSGRFCGGLRRNNDSNGGRNKVREEAARGDSVPRDAVLNMYRLREGQPGRPQDNGRQGGRPGRPEEDNNRSGRPGRPEDNNRSGRPGRPEEENNRSGRPGRPEEENNRSGRPGRPEEDNNRSGRPGRPEEDNNRSGRPGRPEEDNNRSGRPGRPEEDNERSGRPGRPEGDDRSGRPTGRPTNGDRPGRPGEPTETGRPGRPNGEQGGRPNGEQGGRPNGEQGGRPGRPEGEGGARPGRPEGEGGARPGRPEGEGGSRAGGRPGSSEDDEEGARPGRPGETGRPGRPTGEAGSRPGRPGGEEGDRPGRPGGDDKEGEDSQSGRPTGRPDGSATNSRRPRPASATSTLSAKNGRPTDKDGEEEEDSKPTDKDGKPTDEHDGDAPHSTHSSTSEAAHVTHSTSKTAHVTPTPTPPPHPHQRHHNKPHTSIVTTIQYKMVDVERNRIVATEFCTTIFYQGCAACQVQHIPEIPMATVRVECDSCGVNGANHAIVTGPLPVLATAVPKFQKYANNLADAGELEAQAQEAEAEALAEEEAWAEEDRLLDEGASPAGGAGGAGGAEGLAGPEDEEEGWDALDDEFSDELSDQFPEGETGDEFGDEPGGEGSTVSGSYSSYDTICISLLLVLGAMPMLL